MRIVNPTIEITRSTIGHAVVMQYFSHPVAPETCLDAWVTLGIQGYLTGLFIETTLGTNEYRYQIQREIDWLLPRENATREALVNKSAALMSPCSSSKPVVCMAVATIPSNMCALGVHRALCD